MTNFDILRQEFLNKLNETGSVRSPELQLDGISEDYMDFMIKLVLRNTVFLVMRLASR